MKLSNTELLLIGAFGIALIYAWKVGLFKADKGFKTSEGNTTDGSSTTIDDNTSKNIAKSFRDALIGNSTSYSIFINACDSLLKLNDADLIKVSNAYNALYVNKDYNTLRSLLIQEWIVYYVSAEKKRELLERFNQIGI